MPSSTTTSQKVGGEYGEIRGVGIDVAKLNDYLTKKVSAIQTPVDVKQFKVGGRINL